VIWLDMDGVVADFDLGYFNLFGEHPTRWPEAETVKWKLVHSVPDFYRRLPLMAGAHDLFKCAKEIDDTGFLTGVPKSITTCEAQKREYIAENFGADVIVKCCPSRDKWRECRPGDTLVDDYTRYRVDWERADGIFVHHTSAADSIHQLGELASWNVIGRYSQPSR
jgi:hypothetical protein